MNLLITNIKELVQVEFNPVSKRNGTEMNQLNTVQNAYLEIRNGTITSFGKMEDAPNSTSWSDSDVIDATGKMVFPSWCDSHSHLVFASSREGEFVDRINGLTYEEIALKGGGILNSAEKLEQMDEESLYECAQIRLKEVIALGTGAIEIKSGYGLSVSAELKMLRVIKKLKNNSPVTIKATFLGAHAIPNEFKENRKGYIDLVINEMLPIIQKENLADYIDVFCEKNYYTPSETALILSEGKKNWFNSKNSCEPIQCHRWSSSWC